MRVTERDLEERARLVEGETLVRVLYQRPRELGVEHAVERAVYLECESGFRAAIGTSDELRVHHGFGVTVGEQRVIDPAWGEIVDVSSDVRWKGRLGSRIVRAMIRWDDVRERLRSSLSIGVSIHADYLRRQDFPASLDLDIGGSVISFMAARRARDGTLALLESALLISFETNQS